MKNVLLVGHSMMTAHNMARDLIEDRDETVAKTEKRAGLPFVLTTNDTQYVFLAQFEVESKEMELRGRTFDEVYFMSDFKAGTVESLKQQLKDVSHNASFFLVEEDFIGVAYKQSKSETAFK
jgi:hypothetical protein